MERPDDKTALVTGANVGLGKEVARQLAASGHYRQVYLGCRNRTKADAAQRDLEAATGKAVFEVAVMDVADLASVRAAVASLAEPVDDLVMNAGGMGGPTPLAKTKAGVTTIFATNVLGHVALLEGLIAADKLKRAAVYVGSEAARGVPKLGMKRPALDTSSADEFAALCDGAYFANHKFNGGLAYSQAKYVAALWMASAARRYPARRLVTVSPGNTAGTEVAKDLPAPLRLMLKYVLMPVVMPVFGLVHGVDVGAKRLVDGLTDPALHTGTFYASAANTLTGPLVDQSTIFPDLANHAVQDNANAAVHRFT